MRPLVVVSHTYVEAANRGKLRALARDGRVTAIVPATWRDPTLGRTWRHAVPATDGGVAIHPARWVGPHHPSAGAMWSPAALLRDPDTIVQVEEEPWTPSAWLAVKRARGPVFLFTWDNIARRLPPPWSSFRQAVLRRVTGVIAGNTAAADVVRRFGYTGPVAVIPQLGVSAGPLPERIMSAELRVAYVGRLVREKGVDLLVRAVIAIGGPITLTIVGDGPERGALERMAAPAGGRIRFMGPRPHAAVASIWAGIDVLVLPSRTAPRWREQLGHVLLEAMAHGVAVVGAASGAIPDVIGDAGIVFPEGDSEALARILSALAADRDRPAVLGRAGHARVQAEFTDDAIAARTRTYHAQVVGSGTDS